MSVIDKEKAALQAIQAYVSFPVTKSSNQNLLDVLWTIFSNDEVPEGGLEGLYSWLWVTNKRLLAVTIDRPLFGNKKWKATRVDEYPYSKINSVGFTVESHGWLKDPTNDTITINFAGRTVEFRMLEHRRFKEFAELIKTKLSPSQSFDIQNALTDNSVDPLANLERLVQLKTQGMLTEEEFKAAKTKLLGL